MHNIDLAEENYNFCLYWVHHVGVSYIRDFDECLSIAHIGYCEAANSYNPSKGAFTTYAATCMLNMMLRELRNRRALKRKCVEVSLDDLVSNPDTNNDKLLVDKAGIDVSIVEVSDIIQKCLNSFSDRDKNIIKDYIYNSYSQRGLGTKYNLCQPQISRIVSKFKKLLSKEITV